MINGYHWTPEEDQYIKDHHQDTLYVNIAGVLGRTAGAVRHRAQKLGLSRCNPRFKHLYRGDWLPELAPAQRGYLAGIIDGDGSISIHRCYSTGRSKPRYQPIVYVSGTDKRLAEYLQELLGARYYARRRKIDNRGSIKATRPQFQIGWTGYRCHPVLKLIEPYLVIKQDRAKLVMEFIESRVSMPSYNLPYTQEQVAIYEAFRGSSRRGSHLLEV